MTRKQAAVPAVATITPATAGPMTRAALKVSEFSAMALSRSSRPTISTTNDWRAGMSSAFAVPSSSAAVITCQTWTWPQSVSSPSARATAVDTLWVAISSERLGKRSAATPPMSENASTGKVPAAPTAPSQNGWLVNSSTSQPCATACIQVPEQAHQLREPVEPEIAVPQGGERATGEVHRSRASGGTQAPGRGARRQDGAVEQGAVEAAFPPFAVEDGEFAALHLDDLVAGEEAAHPQAGGERALLAIETNAYETHGRTSVMRPSTAYETLPRRRHHSASTTRSERPESL